MEKKPGTSKVCVNQHLLGDRISLTKSKVAEVEFASLDELTMNIKLVFQVPSGKVNFHGRAGIASDPSTGAREHVQLVAAEIWRVSGYRFK